MPRFPGAPIIAVGDGSCCCPPITGGGSSSSSSGSGPPPIKTPCCPGNDIPQELVLSLTGTLCDCRTGDYQLLWDGMQWTGTIAGCDRPNIANLYCIPGLDGGPSTFQLDIICFQDDGTPTTTGFGADPDSTCDPLELIFGFSALFGCVGVVQYGTNCGLGAACCLTVTE